MNLHFPTISIIIDILKCLHLILENHIINFARKPGQITGHFSNFSALKFQKRSLLKIEISKPHLQSAN